MARWLALAISKDCGCNSRSLQDDWGMTWWLAPTTSKEFGCNCRPPRDGWEMAGWSARGISNDSGRNVGSLGDAWEMAGRWLREHLLYYYTQYNKDHQYNKKTYSTHNTKTQWLGVGSGYFKQIECESKSPGVARRWLGNGPGYFQRLRVLF